MQFLVLPAPYFEARHDYTNNSEHFFLCNKCMQLVFLIPKPHMCVIGRSQKVPYEGTRITQKNSCPMKAPKLHKRIPARKRYVADVLCNWQINSQTINIFVIILGTLNGQIANRQSPITGVQRRRSTLASHSAVPLGVVLPHLPVGKKVLRFCLV